MRRYFTVALVFLLVTLPGAINTWLSLYDRFINNAEKPFRIPLADWYSVGFPLLGLAVLIFGIWWTRPSKVVKPENHNNFNE